MTTATDVSKEQLKVLKHWERFLASGCKWARFTKALYGHLYQNFGFIAHYNRLGFWENRFSGPRELRETFSLILQPESYYVDRGPSIALNKQIMRVAQQYATVLLTEANALELAGMKTAHAALGQEIARREH